MTMKYFRLRILLLPMPLHAGWMTLVVHGKKKRLISTQESLSPPRGGADELVEEVLDPGFFV